MKLNHHNPAGILFTHHRKSKPFRSESLADTRRTLQYDIFLSFYEVNQCIVTFGIHENFTKEIILGIGIIHNFFFFDNTCGIVIDKEGFQFLHIIGVRSNVSKCFRNSLPWVIPFPLMCPFIKVNQKEQDFAIYKNIELTIQDETINISVPVVSMECKTYLDKTMLDGSIATAEKVKMGNPYCLFFIVTETYDVSYEVDPIYSRIDAIYVLRKQKRRSGELNPIDSEVVYDLYSTVKNHLESDWSNIEEKVSKHGRAI